MQEQTIFIEALDKEDPAERAAHLAGVRDVPALDELPETERQAWRQLWAEVSAVLKSVLQTP
jgi:hypothetical protein